MSDEEKTFKVSMKREKDFVFTVDFGLPGAETLTMDEPTPLGRRHWAKRIQGTGSRHGQLPHSQPNVLLQKARAEIGEIETKVEGKMRRNDKGRWRIAEVNVEISPEIDLGEYQNQYDRCFKLFEDFCIVSKSIEEESR